MSDHPSRGEKQRLARAVQQACFRAAVEAYEDAGMRGLCREGAWEVALDAIRALNIEKIVGSPPED